MALIEVILWPLLIFVVAAFFGPLGLGGGLFYVPILHYIGGFEWSLSVIVSLLLVWGVSIGSRMAHQIRGCVDSTATKMMLRGALPGAIAGTAISIWLITESGDSILKILAVLVVTESVRRSIKRLRTDANVSQEPAHSLQQESGPVDREGVASTNRMGLTLGGVLGGVISAMLGIGGGVVYVPLSREYANLSPRVAVGTSNGVMVWVVLVALVANLVTYGGTLASDFGEHGVIYLTFTAIGLLIGAISFAWFGVHISMRYFRENIVVKGFILALLVTAFVYLVDIFGN